MELSKRLSIVFLSAINLMNIIAGIIVQIKIITGSDVTSIIPISGEMTVNQVLMANFMCITLIIMLISVVATYLITDIPYSPKEILSNCPGLFLIVPAIILGLGIFNAVKAPISVDKITIIACSIAYFLANVVNFGCIITVKEDAEEE